MPASVTHIPITCCVQHRSGTPCGGLGYSASPPERSGISSMIGHLPRRSTISNSAAYGSTASSRSVSRAHSCSSCSSESDGDNYSPPCSPRPERPNRSRRPFSFLRERSVAGLSRFCRRSDANNTATPGNAADQTRSSGRGNGHGRREIRRRSSANALLGPPGFSHRFHAMRLSEQTTFGLGRRDGDMILPCGLFQEEVIDLMHRDLRPEDFEMLSKLDERLPKRNVAHSDFVDILPRITAKDCGVSECRVCLTEVAPTTVLAKLPCGHAFHPGCISKWLTQCKNTCPLCSKPIEGSKDGLPSRKIEAAATTLRRDEAQRQLEPRSLPISIQRQVRSLHL